MAIEFPTKWATLDLAWGEGRKHVYCPDPESLSFHQTEGHARESAKKDIREGAKMVAILEIKTAFIAEPAEVTEEHIR